jgi:endonuclease-3
MYAATTLSSAKSISAESLNLRSDSNSEAAHGASESETRVSLRKKRIKQDDLEPVKKCSARETKARKVIYNRVFGNFKSCVEYDNF